MNSVQMEIGERERGREGERERERERERGGTKKAFRERGEKMIKKEKRPDALQANETQVG